MKRGEARFGSARRAVAGRWNPDKAGGLVGQPLVQRSGRTLSESTTQTRKKPVRQRSAKIGTQRISAHEVEEVEDRSSPRTPVIYEIVRRLGEEEMARPAISLWWSGIAAGISISFSTLAQALLQMHLPDEPWRPLIVSLGYSVGFVMVVLSRQQLFTENTITVVLPVVAKPTRARIVTMLRMWGIVFLANMAGTLFAALFCAHTPALSPEVLATMQEIGRHMMQHGWFAMFFRAIGAGFLVAAMVWLLPSAAPSQFHIVVLMTWLIALGGFTHIVAGSVEAFLLVASGDLALPAMIGHFTIPVLLGNVVGGTALFALLSYAQVMKEI
jgi:formate-nitrite transporter family protein